MSKQLHLGTQAVKEIMVDDKGCVQGVRLVDGTEVLSKVVLSNATPQVTFMNLLPSGTLPQSYINKVKSVDYSSPVTKINGLKQIPFSSVLNCHPECILPCLFCCDGCSCIKWTAEFPGRSSLFSKGKCRSAPSLHHPFEL